MLRRLKGALSKTRQRWRQGLENLIHGKKTIDADLLERLEEILMSADLGIHTVQRLLTGVRDRLDRHERADPSRLNVFLKAELLAVLKKKESPLDLSGPVPFVVMMVGVNGVGKTTTIGKLALKFSQEGRSVLLVAGDTFRAAAIEQLEIWGQRVGCPVIKHQSGSDPSAVIFDGLSAAKARGTDVVIVDTAGRMHTKFNLMEELKKIKRVVAKHDASAPHQVLLVMDATTGQNGLAQAKHFTEVVDVTDVFLAKLDGTARGGIVFAICDQLNIPISYIGTGEKLQDIAPFDAKVFVNAIFA